MAVIILSAVPHQYRVWKVNAISLDPILAQYLFSTFKLQPSTSIIHITTLSSRYLSHNTGPRESVYANTEG